ncbi:unnamed protein product [Didymodactylos carnosus]|uniref:RING-type domain-containing protein n=1 Tax=Didymodactylos carnosus TaxID=1234261 RepID=A0A814G579_9BILA|nr:unnamed protein product [Didymodactylos carnosus]CAF0993790.1 unnamed protein product [Didymodactylos carnosus]CAF3708222.1 unnamed protein product [Didymodactylos carnosus]CAF3765570.1 unnamed protein product [Didymodactylos carnosus]
MLLWESSAYGYSYTNCFLSSDEEHEDVDGRSGNDDTKENPYFLPCGHSFDEKCIQHHIQQHGNHKSTSLHCPSCKKPFDPNISFVTHWNLLSVAQSIQTTSEFIYEIYLLDTSTSMWYSDFIIGLIETSRLQLAKQFLKCSLTKRYEIDSNVEFEYDSYIDPDRVVRLLDVDRVLLPSQEFIRALSTSNDALHS